MRCSGLVALSFAFLASSLAGQGFEGTISMKTSGNPSRAITWFIKGPMSLASTAAPAASTSQPQPADSTSQPQPVSRVVIDNSAETSTLLLPLPMAIAQLANGMAGLRLVSDLKKPPRQSDSTKAPVAPPRKLGTSQTIAGMKCDDYELGDSAKTRACLTNVLGRFVLPPVTRVSMGGLGVALLRAGPGANAMVMTSDSAVGVNSMSPDYVRALSEVRISSLSAARNSAVARDSAVVRDSAVAREVAAQAQGTGDGLLVRGSCTAPPSWVTAIGGAGFPLKVWTASGKAIKAIMEVTDINRGPVSDDLFAIPDGYQDVEAYMGSVVVQGCGGADHS